MEQRNDGEDDDEADGGCDRQGTCGQDFEDFEHGVSLLVGGHYKVGNSRENRKTIGSGELSAS